MPAMKLHEGIQVRVRDSAAEYQFQALSSDAYEHWRDLGVPQLICYEQVEYLFEGTGIREIHCGAETAEQLINNLYRYTFRNQIGHSRITTEFTNGHVTTTDVEVLSRKFPSIPSHLRFYIALVDDLFTRHIGLPFDIESPTYYGVDESPEPPTLLFIYHFLSSRAQALAQAIQIILSSPHRLLTTQREQIPIYRANRIEIDTIYAMLAHAEQLQRTNANLLIAQKLNGYAPLQIFQDTPIETLDTPENRFVKHFLNALFVWAERLLDHPLFRDRESNALRYVHSLLEMAKQNPLFDNVGEMTMFPSTSTVLLKRDGYRELLQLYREFNLSRMPIWRAVQDAIDARDIAKMYEYWCLFELAQKLEQVCGKRAFKFNFGTTGEVSEGKIVAEYADGSRLAYNRQFAQGEGASYAVAVRPDFVFQDKHGQRLIFDAKFSFDQSGNIEEDEIIRTAKDAHILKMSGYKDQLHARAAFVIFPNDDPTNDRYDSETGEPAPASFADFVKGTWRGVGAIGMMPKPQEKKDG